MGRIEGFIKTSVPRATIPTVEAIEVARGGVSIERVSAGLTKGRLGQERALVNTLLEAGHDPVEIAGGGALRLVRGDEAQRPILPVTEVQERRPQREPASRNATLRAPGFRAPATQTPRNMGRSEPAWSA